MGGAINRSAECDIALLREYLDYDSETGILTWKHRQASRFAAGNNMIGAAKAWNARHAGKMAFTAIDGDGYLTGSIHNRLYRAQRVCFAHYYGYWPDEVDHQDGVRSNNRINNLKDTGSVGNMRNKGLDRRNKSGYSGVYELSTVNLRWQAKIGVNGKKLSRNFNTKSEAVNQRAIWEKQFGFHENHGKRERHTV